MKHIYFLVPIFIGFLQISYSQTQYSQALSCNSGSFSMGYVQNNPESDSLTNIGGFSLEATFLKRQRPFFNTSFGIESNFGARTFDRAIENIEFEGGYTGFASYSLNRVDIWGKYIIGAQLGKIVEFSVPFRLGFRTMGYRQEFDLYEGQVIAEEDMVSESEAAEQNNDAFFRSNKLGFGTGIHLAFIPNGVVSPFFEIGYNYFGKTELPLPDQAELISGDVFVPNINLSNNNELSFRIGIRFNIGCPSNMTRVYGNPTNSGRNVAYTKHPAVETRIVRNTSNSQNTNTQNSNKPERVILTPSKPRAPRTPQDSILF